MAQGNNMHTTEIEIKAIAKAVGASLGRQGHKVPQSNLLHALASALDKRDWNTLKSQISTKAITASLATMQVQETLTDELPSSYTEKARFWVKLAYLAGNPLKQIPDSSDEALRLARVHVGDNQTGVLKWCGWSVPADLNYETSTIDAGGFRVELNAQTGTFLIRLEHATLELEVVFSNESGWYASNYGTSSLFDRVKALVSDEMVIDATEQAVSLSLSGPAVPARFYTDDHAFSADFDARAYLTVAADKNLTAIINAGYGGDYCTDAIAEFFSDKNLNDTLVKGFQYLSICMEVPGRDSVGFECRVDGPAFLQWMHAHKPLVLARELCSRADVRIVQAQEEEVKGMWDWIGDEGHVCECSFDTEEEAILDAYQRLKLLDSEIADAASLG